MYTSRQIQVAYNFDTYDNIYIFSKYSNQVAIILIYDNTNNNLVICDIHKLSLFLMYNTNINDRYTFISLYNNIYYGKSIDNDLLKYLIRIALSVLNIIIDKIDKRVTNILTILIQRLTNIKYNKSFNFKKKLELTFFNFNIPRD